MIRKTLFAVATVATVAAIGAAALIPTEASAGGGGKGGGMGGGHHGHWGHGYWGGGFTSTVVIGPSCWRWVNRSLSTQLMQRHVRNSRTASTAAE